MLSIGSEWPALAGSMPDGVLVRAGAWLLLAFVLGLVHAFDADHVMAMSVFATRSRGALRGARAGLRWSAGHGLVLLAVGILLLFLGRSLPMEVVSFAERAVGWVMVGLGGYVWLDLVRRRSHLHFHQHDDLPSHAHWHTHDIRSDGTRQGAALHGESHEHAHSHRHEHGAMLVGALHGLAGSAPILAVLPAAAHSPTLGILYLLLFTLGVGFSMAIVSGLMGHLAGRLRLRGDSRGLSVLRALSATGSIGLGVWLATAV